MLQRTRRGRRGCNRCLPCAVAELLSLDASMLFIHPMWYHESQRIGKRKCTPIGYVIHVIADLIGIVGLILLLATPVILVWKWIVGTFQASLLWLVAASFCLGIVSELFY